MAEAHAVCTKCHDGSKLVRLDDYCLCFLSDGLIAVDDTRLI